MTTLETLLVEIKADNTRLRADLNRAVSSSERASRRMSQAFRAVGGAVAAIGVGFTVDRVIRGIGNLASSAQRADNQLKVFNNTLSRFGQDANAAERLVARLSDRFGVLPATIREGATLLLRAGADLNDVERAFTAAGASAAATGFDISQSFQNVAVAVATGRSELLETSGIVANLGPVTQQYANSIGKTVEQLTDQEKTQARINAIYEETRFEIADLDTLLSGLTANQNELRTEFAELSVTLGETFLPVVNAVVGGIADLLGGLNDLIARLRGETTKELQDFSDTIGDANDADSVIGAVDRLAETLGVDATEAFEGIRTKIQEASGDLEELKGLALQSAEALELLAERQELLRQQAALSEIAPFLAVSAGLSVDELRDRLVRGGAAEAASRLAIDPDTNQLDLSRFLGAVPFENRPAAIEALRGGTLGLENIPGSGVNSREISDLIINFLRSGDFAAGPFQELTNALEANQAALDALAAPPARTERPPPVVPGGLGEEAGQAVGEFVTVLTDAERAVREASRGLRVNGVIDETAVEEFLAVFTDAERAVREASRGLLVNGGIEQTIVEELVTVFTDAERAVREASRGLRAGGTVDEFVTVFTDAERAVREASRGLRAGGTVEQTAVERAAEATRRNVALQPFERAVPGVFQPSQARPAVGPVDVDRVLREQAEVARLAALGEAAGARIITALADATARGAEAAAVRESERLAREQDTAVAFALGRIRRETDPLVQAQLAQQQGAPGAPQSAEAIAAFNAEVERANIAAAESAGQLTAFEAETRRAAIAVKEYADAQQQALAAGQLTEAERRIREQSRGIQGFVSEGLTFEQREAAVAGGGLTAREREIRGDVADVRAPDFTERFELAGQQFADEAIQGGLSFLSTVESAGSSFLSAVESFAGGDVGGGISALGQGVGTIVGAVNPLVGAAIGVGAGLLGGLIGQIGGRDDAAAESAAQARRSLSTLELNFTFNQTNSLGLLDDPTTTRKLEENAESAFRRFEDIIKRNVNPRLEALEARI